MRIIWLADYTTKDRPGGAQITNKLMIEAGRKLGYTIVEVNHKDFGFFNFQPTDVVILNNMAKLNSENRNKLLWVMDNLPFIRYVHDYDWVYNDMQEGVIAKSFGASRGSVFLSPLHYETILDKGFNLVNPAIIPSPIELRKYKITSTKRKKNSVVYAGEINTHKGINHIYNYALFHPEKTIDIYGWVAHQGLMQSPPSNVHFKEKQPHEDMAQVFNQYMETIHLPIWREPFGRSVAEAYLCGCKIISNGKVGFMSYQWSFDDQKKVREELEKSTEKFWDHVEKYLLKND